MAVDVAASAVENWSHCIAQPVRADEFRRHRLVLVYRSSLPHGALRSQVGETLDNLANQSTNSLAGVVAKAEWVDVVEAARRLDVPTRIVYEWISSGYLYAEGKPLRVRASDLVHCLEHHRIKPGGLVHMNPYPGGASKADSVH